jgi:hypothetical protein
MWDPYSLQPYRPPRPVTGIAFYPNIMYMNMACDGLTDKGKLITGVPLECYKQGNRRWYTHQLNVINGETRTPPFFGCGVHSQSEENGLGVMRSSFPPGPTYITLTSAGSNLRNVYTISVCMNCGRSLESSCSNFLAAADDFSLLLTLGEMAEK